MNSETTLVPPPVALITRPGGDGQGEAYTVVERLGESASAVVYRAKEAASGKDVRFKVLRPSAPDEVALDAHKLAELFPQVSGLSHPHIAQWLDAYLDPDGFVLVHDFLDGISGGSVPINQELSAVEARTLARQMCQALLAGEQAGIPHGDIKPGNLVIAKHEREGLYVQVQDWALSCCRAKPNQESLFFMAPERLRGDPPSVQSDLFSISATLCYLITGFVPVQGADVEAVLAQWPHFDAMVLGQLRDDLDEHFLKWLAWLTRLRPEDRPASVAQALEVLWQVIAYANAGKSKPAAAAGTQTPLMQKLAAAPVAPRPTPARTKTRRPEDEQPALETPKKVPAAKPPRRWLRKLIAMSGIMAAFVGVACAWLRFDWGPAWTTELGRRWEQWSFENLPSVTMRHAAVEQTPEPAAVAVETPKVPAAPKKPTAPPKPAPQPARLVTETFDYGDGKSLDGGAGGANWTEPWKAQNVAIGRSSDGKYVFANLGGEKDSTAQRSAGALGKLLIKNGTYLVITLNHPGADAPPFKALLRGFADSHGPASLIITPEAGKLRLSIDGSTELIEVPASKTFRVAVRFDLKKQRNGKHDVEIRAFLNPNAKSSSPLSGCSSSRRVLSGIRAPDQCVFSMEAKGGTRPVTVGAIGIGGQLADLLK